MTPTNRTRIDLAGLAEALATRHPAELAETLAELDPEELAVQLRALPPRRQAELLGYLAPEAQVALAERLSRSELAAVIAAMSPDERADLFNRLSPEQQQALLPGLAHALREDIRRLAAYAEGSAGALMTSDYATLEPGLTVAEAIERLRREAPDKETIYEAYVVDGERRLIGVVSLRDLLMAKDDARVAEVMRRDAVAGRADDSREAVAEMIANYDLLALPIVDGNGMMVGIVTVDDAFDVSEAERGRRLIQFGGNLPVGGPELDLRGSSLVRMVRVRAFWLVILTVFGAITSTFVAAQEAILAQAIVLAAFIAPIVDMGGNIGSQSATLVLRAMALGQVKPRWRDIGFVIRREIPVALALGLTIALLEAVLASLSKGVGGEILLIVGLSMLLCTVAGGIIGALLPFAAKRVGADPATLSAPMITSIMDLLGVMIYFALAYAVLGDQLTGG